VDAEILRNELECAGDPGLARTVHKKLERVKQMACIKKHVSLTTTSKRFSRVSQPSSRVQVERPEYDTSPRGDEGGQHHPPETKPRRVHAHPAQLFHEQHSAAQMAAEYGGRRKPTWDASYGQVEERAYIRNVRNTKLLRDSGPARAKQVEGRDRDSTRRRPHAAAALQRVLEQRRQCAESCAARQAAARGAAHASNSGKHAAVCTQHSAGSFAAGARVASITRCGAAVRQRRCAEPHSTEPHTAQRSIRMRQGHAAPAAPALRGATLPRGHTGTVCAGAAGARRHDSSVPGAAAGALCWQQQRL
jgi:hypothetical protein